MTTFLPKKPHREQAEGLQSTTVTGMPGLIMRFHIEYRFFFGLRKERYLLTRMILDKK